MPVWMLFPLLISWMETNLHRKDESKEQKRAAVAKTAGMRDASSLWHKYVGIIELEERIWIYGNK